MKTLAAALVLTTFLAIPAYAGILTVSVADNGVGIPMVCAGGANAPISCDGGDAAFSGIHVGAIGVPDLPNADLSSITLTATSALGGTHVLDVTVNQGGLFIQGLTTGTSTFTVNNLVGGPFGPTTETTRVNGSQLAAHTFDATTTVGNAESTDALPATILSDAHTYSVTFTSADQTATDTIQLATNAPEPSGIALMGMGLLGLAAVRRRS